MEFMKSSFLYPIVFLTITNVTQEGRKSAAGLDNGTRQRLLYTGDHPTGSLAQPFLASLAQVSLRGTMRLKTAFSAVESLSLQK